MRDRYEYDAISGFIVDTDDYDAVITSIKHQRLGYFIVKLLNEKEATIRDLKKQLSDGNE